MTTVYVYSYFINIVRLSFISPAMVPPSSPKYLDFIIYAEERILQKTAIRNIEVSSEISVTNGNKSANISRWSCISQKSEAATTKQKSAENCDGSNCPAHDS